MARVGCLRGALVVTAAVAGLAAGRAQAGNYDIGSIASPFLQSKTQITILSHDDLAAPTSNQKRFVHIDADPQPVLAKTGAVAERKWKEDWTLERCGTQVHYWVFFTEVGAGGAYYAIVDPAQ